MARNIQEEGSDIEKVLQYHQQAQSYKGRFRPGQPGEYIIRMLPTGHGGKYFREFGVHYSLAEALIRVPDGKPGVLCRRRTIEQACPLCTFQEDVRMRATAESDERLAKIAKDIRARTRVVMNVLNYKAPDEGVLTWETGYTNFEHFGPICEEYGDITNTAKGRWLRCQFVKQGDFLTLRSVLPMKPAAIDEERFPDWRSQRKDLDEYLTSKLDDAAVLQALVDESRLLTDGIRSRVTSAPKPAAQAPAALEADLEPEDTETDLWQDEEEPKAEGSTDDEDEEVRKAREAFEAAQKKAKSRRVQA